MRWGEKIVLDVGYIFPFGTSLFFVYFICYAIWLTIWKPYTTFARMWRLGASAFLAGTMLALTFAQWVDAALTTEAAIIVSVLWTACNLWMIRWIVKQQVALDRAKQRFEGIQDHDL
jgi:hypothetical protein